MTDKQFRSLSKTELIDILLKQESIIEKIRKEKKALEDEITDRNIKMEQAGSLAEITAIISGLFDSAQETADLYLDSIVTIESKKLKNLRQLENEVKDRTDAFYDEAEKVFSEVFSPFIDLATDTHNILNTYSAKLDLARRDYDKLLEEAGLYDIKRRLGEKMPNNDEEQNDDLIENIQTEISEEENAASEENAENEEIRPSVEQLSDELTRRRNKSSLVKNILSIIGVLVVFAAASILISTYLLPVFNIQQNSMNPTLENGQVVVFSATGDVEKSDIVAFHHNNSLLIKRVIGAPGDLVDISDDGEVSVNGVILDEPYVNSLDIGECDIELPFRVPEGRYFVMGDNRADSLDSRYKEIGAISEEQIAGTALLRVLPLGKIKLF
jgi:signal peptidase I